MTSISRNDQAHRRGGHVVGHFRNELIVWGGVVEHLNPKPSLPNTIPTNGNDFHDNGTIMIMDADGLWWRRVNCQGNIPPRTFGASSCTVENEMFVYGGYLGYESDQFCESSESDNLSRLNLDTFEWKNMPKSGSDHPPGVEKSVLVHHSGFLYLHGGYGTAPNGFEGHTVEFMADDSSRWTCQSGWYGNLWRFSLATKVWNWVSTRGPRPAPMAGHSGLVHNGQMFLFGGRSRRSRSNALYSFSFAHQMWSRVAILSEDLPEPRSMCSLTKLGTGQALLYGGLGQLCAPLNDAWLLDMDRQCWREIPLRYDHGQIRCYHGAIATSWNEVLVHSGFTQEHYLNRIQLDQHPEQTILRFPLGVSSLLRLAGNVVWKSHLPTKNLPSSLQKMLTNRSLHGNVDLGDGPSPPGSEAFDRDGLHRGI